jgi:hypothetical protein
MRNRILQVAISAVLCSYAWNAGAQSEVSVDRSTIAALLTKRNTQELERVVGRIEQDWGRTRDPVYFERMNIICQEIAAHVARNAEWFSRLFGYSSLLVEKSEQVKESDRCIMYANQTEVIHRMLDLLTDKALRDNPTWHQNRSNAFGLLVVFHSRIQKQYVLDFKPYNVAMNVMPPAGSGADAGADPASIKDPKVRADYEAAIRENVRRGAINREQRCLADIMQNELPRYELAFVEAYSIEPLNYEELGKYLQVGCFGDQVRYRIISSVVKATGKPVPVHILPPPSSQGGNRGQGE